MAVRDRVGDRARELVLPARRSPPIPATAASRSACGSVRHDTVAAVGVRCVARSSGARYGGSSARFRHPMRLAYALPGERTGTRPHPAAHHRHVGGAAARTPTAAVDWPAFEAHVARTRGAGLTPAVNMDTGYVQLLDRRRPRARARPRSAGHRRRVRRRRLRAPTSPGARVRPRRLLRARPRRSPRGRHARDLPVARSQRARRRRLGRARTTRIGRRFDRFIGFELGRDVRAVRPDRTPSTRTTGCWRSRAASAPSTRRCRRPAEWDRLEVRDAVAPGLPRVHRQRPRHRHGDVRLRLPPRPVDVRARGVRRARPAVGAGDPSFHELNDLLQYLGAFAFRPGARVPARRRAVPAAPRAGLDATRRRPARPAGPTATARCSRTSPSGSDALL